MDKFDLSISAKGLLQCSIDLFTKGKRGACVYQYKDCKVNDVHEFIAALAFIDILKSPISYMYHMIDQVFGPITKSTTNTGRFPKAVGIYIIGLMSDISGSLSIMLNESQGMMVLTMLCRGFFIPRTLHCGYKRSRLRLFNGSKRLRIPRRGKDIDKSRFARDSSIPGLHRVHDSGRIYEQRHVFIQCTIQGFIIEAIQAGKCAAVECCPLDHDTA
jgi:hypothetical protein